MTRRGIQTVRMRADDPIPAFIAPRVEGIIEACVRHAGLDRNPARSIGMSCYLQAIEDIVQLQMERGDVVNIPPSTTVLEGMALPEDMVMT